MIDRAFGIDVGLPTLEQFREELFSEKGLNIELADKALKEYSAQYHRCAELVMNGRVDEAEELRNNLQK